MFTFFGSLLFNCLNLFQAYFLGVLLLRELTNFFQPSFQLFLARLFNSAVFVFTEWDGARDWFSWWLCRIVLFCLLVFVADCSTRTWGSVFFSISGIADFEEIWIFFSYKRSVKDSADFTRFGFETFFHASFDIKRYQFSLLTLDFVIVVWGFEFVLWTITVIT